VVDDPGMIDPAEVPVDSVTADVRTVLIVTVDAGPVTVYETVAVASGLACVVVMQVCVVIT